MTFKMNEPCIATEKDVKLPWSCGKNGKYFRCAFCGHKFKVGDYFRAQFTNDTPGAGGNPFVCEKCDDEDRSKVVQKWKEKCEDWKSDKWWWFRRYKD